MNFKRNLGIGFIFLSIIISAANMNMTGAVIGSSLSNLFSFVALVFFIGGIGLLMAGREIKEGGLAKLASDQEITLALRDAGIAVKDQTPREEKLKEISDTLGGLAKFYVPSIKNGEVVYVHLTKKKAARSIAKQGGRLRHGGTSTYGQAFVFTGKDASVKAREFVDSLSRKRKYVGVSNPTNAIIFKTDIVPDLNKISASVPNYPGDRKAMFNHDVPRSLMYDVENRNISV